MVKKMEPLYLIYYLSTRRIDSTKSIIYVFMFDGYLNVQLGGDILKIRYPNLTVVCGVEKCLYIFQSSFQNTNCEPDGYRSQWNIKHFCIWITSKSALCFKPNYYEFFNRNIGLFSGNDTRMLDIAW